MGLGLSEAVSEEGLGDGVCDGSWVGSGHLRKNVESGTGIWTPSALEVGAMQM